MKAKRYINIIIMKRIHFAVLACQIITLAGSMSAKGQEYDPFPTGTVVKFNKSFNNGECLSSFNKIENGKRIRAVYNNLTLDDGGLHCGGIKDSGKYKNNRSIPIPGWLIKFKACELHPPKSIDNKIKVVAGQTCIVEKTYQSGESQNVYNIVLANCPISLIACSSNGNALPIAHAPSAKTIQSNLGDYISITPPAQTKENPQTSDASIKKSTSSDVRAGTGLDTNSAKVLK